MDIESPEMSPVKGKAARKGQVEADDQGGQFKAVNALRFDLGKARMSLLIPQYHGAPHVVVLFDMSPQASKYYLRLLQLCSIISP